MVQHCSVKRLLQRGPMSSRFSPRLDRGGARMPSSASFLTLIEKIVRMNPSALLCYGYAERALPGAVDLLAVPVHIRGMDFDISHLLDQWDYQPGQVVVRRFKAKDGKEKIQLRVDLGLLQMNAEGRPDGKRPFGHPSLFDYFQARLFKYVGAHNGSDEGFKLKAEEGAKRQIE